jgi:hypothetical protein
VSAGGDFRAARSFRFVRSSFDPATATVELVYALDAQVEFVERVVFPDAPALDPARALAFAAALRLLHLIAGVSYYKAAVPPQIVVEDGPLDAQTAFLCEQVYEHGLAEFAWQNKIDLRGRVAFPVDGAASVRPPSPALPPQGGKGVSAAASSEAPASLPSPLAGEGLGMGGSTLAPTLDLPRRALVPIGGGKDSLVSVEMLRAAGEPATAVWIGNSDLIRACAERTGLPLLNLRREVSPALFELNRKGALNGHVPVTAINSAILVLAALLYGYDSIVFSNERSASSATLHDGDHAVNHQWSKGFAFEQLLGDWLHSHVAADLDYFSLLRPLSELAVTRRFARLGEYHDVFSSCNRNFKIVDARPTARWCGQCPKCHFVFLALAPFVPKPQLTAIFGRNLLDDQDLIAGFDALLEWHAHKPFECVGEALESRAAMAALAARAEWREDAIVVRFRSTILPALDARELALEPLLQVDGAHRIPDRLRGALDAVR